MCLLEAPCVSCFRTISSLFDKRPTSSVCADQGGAYWLLDEIALAQRGNSRVAAEEFQVWKLAVKPDRTATLTCDDGNGNIVASKAIPFTDFPVNEIELWFENNTIYLPSEH
jgi:hypothetical protein